MGFIKARGNTFYYEERGDGPPILLIPPAGSTASTWGTLVGDLAGAGRVIAYDRRGYTRPGAEVVRSAAEHTRDAAAVLDTLDAIPTATVREIDGTAHAVPFDAPGNFARVIVEAMRSSEVRPGPGLPAR